MNTIRMQVSATGRSNPVLSPEPAARSCIAFDQPPSLHPFRADPKHQFVHRLRWHYAAVRLPASVHHRRASLDFSMRSQRAGWEERRISRFSRKLLPCMPGVLDRAGYHCASPTRPTGCCLPPASTESASRVGYFRGSIPCLHFPLSTLRRRSCERRRMTRVVMVG
jgi:hypothetical protein